MRFTTVMFAALAAMTGGVAVANEPAAPAEPVEMCFDKGALSYFPCPTEEVVEEVVVVEEVADDYGFFYVGLRGGYAGFTDVDYFVASVINSKVEVGHSSGWAVGGHIGWQAPAFSHHFDMRFELELAYQTAEVDTMNASDIIFDSLSGDTNNVAFYVNAYGDTKLSDRLDLVLGGGAGVARNKFDNHRFLSGLATGSNDSSDTAFSFHLDAGLAYDVTEHLTLEALYRYTDTVDIKSRSGDGAGDSTSLDSHQALIGLRYAFN